MEEVFWRSWKADGLYYSFENSKLIHLFNELVVLQFFPGLHDAHQRSLDVQLAILLNIVLCLLNLLGNTGIT